jgi:hypothetical protein
MKTPAVAFWKRLILATVLLAALIVVAVPRKDQPRARRTFRYAERSVEVVESQRLIAIGHARAWNAPRFVAAHPHVIARIDERLGERDVTVLAVRLGGLQEALAAARAQDGVRFAHPVYHLGQEMLLDSRHLLTDEAVVRFADGVQRAQAAAIAGAHGATIAQGFGWLAGAYVIKVPATRDALEVANELAGRPDVLFAHPNWLRRLPPRETNPNDPLFGNQWHLKNVGQGGGVAGADIKATYAWDLGQGAGRVIAIIDSGVDDQAQDIVRTANGYNPISGAGPLAGDDVGTHGTCCAGVAAGTGNNGVLLSGVAPAASVMPIRLLAGSGYGTASEEANCFTYAAQNGADVISCSWGPDGVPFLLPPLVAAAFAFATTSGRGGLGCPIFWASGNGNESTSTDQYVSHPAVIAVGAVTNFNVRAPYSDFGTALELVAPSSGGSRNINTVNGGSTYTSNFGGTSAAAPQAAGVAAIMLGIAPSLTWAQVRTILRQTSEKIQPVLALYDAVGHSSTYGYGRLNAYQAALAALATVNTPIGLQAATMGFGDVSVTLSGMGPGAEWVLGVSTVMHAPLGSGPFFGVGFDAFATMTAPLGTLPFHALATPQGGFHWGSTGVPAGFACQLVAVEILAAGGIRVSGVAQLNF